MRPPIHPQPEGGCLSRRRSDQQQDYREAIAASDARRPFANLPRHRFRRGNPQITRCIEASEILPAPWRITGPAGRRGEDDQLLASHCGPQDVSEVTIAAFTRQLFAIRQTVLTEFRSLRRSRHRKPTKDAAIPVHPGAGGLRRWRGKELPRPLTSDMIWWGLMALSAMGSAGGWVRGLPEEGRARQQFTGSRTAARHDRGRRAACDSADREPVNCCRAPSFFRFSPRTRRPLSPWRTAPSVPTRSYRCSGRGSSFPRIDVGRGAG